MYNFYQPTQTLQYVNDKQSAANYQMPNNSSVLLLDRNKDVFYIKQTDASGSYTLDEYEFQKVVEKKIEYATKEDLEELKQMIKEREHEQPIIQQRNDASI